MTFSEDPEGGIIGTFITDPEREYRFRVKILEKESTKQPLDVVEEWYAKLTSEQQENCEIQNADEPTQYFRDGRVLETGRAHPMAHKTRYQIGIKPEIFEAMSEKYGGLPANRDYDYMCGHVVGARLTSTKPYFEFDDRSPSRYLFIGPYGFDTPPLDLNAIGF